MKTRFLFAMTCLSLAVCVEAQTTPAPQDIPFAVVSRTAHSSLWQSTTWDLTPSGQWAPLIHQYVETATGLNFEDSSTGTWLPSSEDIEPYPGGAIATNGQHKVIFAADLATTGAIDLQMPDGQQLQSELIGLRYFDQSSGQSVFIAEVTNCVGEIVGSNQVWYENAFSGLKASVRYTYTIEGFEQDIVLEECPATPEAYGLNSASTVLQAVTEFPSTPTVAVSSHSIAFDSASQMYDETIDFPTMRMGRGRAFLIGDSDSTGVPVAKEWTNWNGQQVLIEQIPMAQIAGQLQTLPNAQTASVKFRRTRTASQNPQLPSRPIARTPSKPMKLASRAPAKSGFLLDYSTLNTTYTNQVFRADTTYYVSGNVNLYGTNNIIEGSTVFKFATNVTLTLDSPVTWLGQPYRPILMLAKDDNTAGQAISGSTGNPGNNYYANVALNFDGTSALTNLTIQGLRVLNAQTAIALNGQSGHSLMDVQVAKCGNGIAATNTDFSLRNALFSFVLTNFAGSRATGRVEHLTSDSAVWLNQNITNLFLTNCLLTSVTNFDNYLTQSVVVTNNTGVYQTAGAGSYYLSTNSPYRNYGTTNISPAVLADIQQKTTYPPIVFSNTTVSTNTEFGPQAQRDTDTPDLGYHYDPLDWCFGGVTADANLTFDAGTAVGWFETGSGYGIQLSNDITNAFNGIVTAPCVFARYSTVQEGNGNWTDSGTLAGITTVANSSYYAEIDADFTHCCGFSWGPCHFRDYLARLDVHANNSEFYAGNFAGYDLGMFMTNCLFDRISQVGSQQKSDGLFWRNCMMHGCQVFAHHSVNWPVWIENCAFDGSTNNMDGNTNMAYCNYNAFVNGAQRLVLLGTNDFVTNTYTWETGPLGNWYQATNSALINAGSVPASVVGLYHFTTQTNQAIEGNSQVDIGYHYVALDSSGNPTDTNGDGIPDYLEDSNGDGVYDSGDLGNWLINPYNGLTLTNGLQVFTPLK